MKLLLIMFAALLLFTGCESLAEKRTNTKGISNVVEEPGNYLSYTLYNGTVKCRESRKRAELACWRTDKGRSEY